MRMLRAWSARSLICAAVLLVGCSTSGPAGDSPGSTPIGSPSTGEHQLESEQPSTNEHQQAPPTDMAGMDAQIAQQTADIASCLRERGFVPRVIPPQEGGWGIEPPEGAGPAYNSAVADCITEVGEVPSPVLSEGLAEQWWQRETDVHTCLEQNGFTVPDFAMDRDTYVAQFLATGTAPWSGSDGLETENQKEWIRAHSLCPAVQ